MRRFAPLLCLSTAFLVGCGERKLSPAVEAATHPDLPFFLDDPGWETDIVIEGPTEDQHAVRSFMYYLRDFYEPGQDTYSPFGSSANLYGDVTFWDADVWLFPAFVFIEPAVARSIAAVRFEGAQSGVYEDWLKSDQHGAAGTYRPERGGVKYVTAANPIRFPWQADPDGKEASEQPTRFQEHVSGSAAWCVDFAMKLGMMAGMAATPIVSGVADYYIKRIEVGPDGFAHIRDIVSVDEWHTGDDCLYTNAVADWVIRRAWGDDAMPLAMYLPRDEEGLLAYEGDERKQYQQAAAQLLLWPLEREDLVGDPIAFLELFEGKEAPTGPAMSLSVNALIRARYGDADEAYATWQESWKRYTKHSPELLFAEKANQPDRTYFGTGAAGCLNAVIYGFMGARVIEADSVSEPAIRLKYGHWLVFRPNLPSAWKKATFKGLEVMGERYTVVCEGRAAVITPEKSRPPGNERRPWRLQETGLGSGVQVELTGGR